MGLSISKEKLQMYQKDINNIKSLLETKNDNNPFTFFKKFPEIENNSFLLNNNSQNMGPDFAVAIYSTRDDIIQILSGNTVIIEQKLYANTYSILKTNPIPVIALQYSWCKIKILTENPGDIHLIMCYCEDELSELLKQVTKLTLCTTIFDGEEERELIYARGRIIFDKEEISSYRDKWEGLDIIMTIPNFYWESEEYKKYLANNTTNMIYYELLEKTMHPDRLKSFMSIDEISKYSIM